jgi:hypothetical protein
MVNYGKRMFEKYNIRQRELTPLPPFPCREGGLKPLYKADREVLKALFSYSPSVVGKGLGVRFFVNIDTFQISSKML